MQGSALGPLFFLISINDLPSIIQCTLSNKNSSVILFAGDTIVIINEPCLTNFESNLNIAFRIIKKWFNSNLLSLNLDKTYYMQFITKNKSLNKINIKHDNKMIIQTDFGNLFGITVDNTFSWKQHIDTIIPKLHKACYIIRRCKLYLSHAALKWYTMLFSLSNVLWFDFFGGNLTNSKSVFKLQKKAIRIIMGTKNNDSRREVF